MKNSPPQAPEESSEEVYSGHGITLHAMKDGTYVKTLASGEKITLTPAEDNPWYRLAERGKNTWNRWARTLLDEEQAKKYNIADLEPFSDEELTQLEEKCGFEKNTLLPSDSRVRIDFSACIFWFPVDFIGYVFLGYTAFTSSHFQGSAYFNSVHFHSIADFTSVCFQDWISFDSVHFHSNAHFASIHFHNYADFSAAIFHSNAHFTSTFFYTPATFTSAHFHSNAHFASVCFQDWIKFSSAIFHSYSDFTSAHFHGDADFSNTNWQDSSHFKNCEFHLPPQFHESTIRQDMFLDQAHFLTPVDAESEESISCWRVLRLAMNQNHNHDMELRFLQLEFDAKTKGHFTKAKQLFSSLFPSKTISSSSRHNFCQKIYLSLTHIFIGIGFLLYKYSSVYGQSILRPLMCLGLATAGFAELYDFFEPLHSIGNKINYSLAFSNMVPFAPSGKLATASLSSVFATGITWGLQLLTIGQTIVSTLFLFLIALGLRNRFRIK